MWSKCCNLLLISILFYNVYSESTETDTMALLKTYKSSVSASHDLDRSDRSILKNWTTDFQLQLVNITTQYRIDMSRHRENNFMWIKSNSKWKECMDFHHIEISNTDKVYFDNESNCLKTANMEESQKKHSVYQMEKEIRKWRKGYKYLLNHCKLNNPGDELAAGDCLVEYMQKDNYYITFQRLILMKLESMSELYSQILISLNHCEECLKNNLLVYYNNVRRVMETLNRCYKLKI